MRYFLFIILLFAAMGCQTSPRFRVGDAVRPGEERNPNQNNGAEPRYVDQPVNRGLTTIEMLKLGQIIESYLGTPYKGQYKKKGIDCSKLVQEVFNRFNGTRLPRTASKQYSYGQRIQNDQKRFGDLVFFRTDGSAISHVGIYIENNEFVHASTSNGVIITSLDEDYWQKRFAGCRRVLK